MNVHRSQNYSNDTIKFCRKLDALVYDGPVLQYEVLQDANGDGNARDFTNRLIALGMPLLEAALIWDAIKKYPQLLLVPVVTTYREKLDLGVL